jgi:hypothetical protein
VGNPKPQTRKPSPSPRDRKPSTCKPSPSPRTRKPLTPQWLQAFDLHEEMKPPRVFAVLYVVPPSRNKLLSLGDSPKKKSFQEPGFFRKVVLCDVVDVQAVLYTPMACRVFSQCTKAGFSATKVLLCICCLGALTMCRICAVYALAMCSTYTLAVRRICTLTERCSDVHARTLRYLCPLRDADACEGVLRCVSLRPRTKVEHRAVFRAL